MQKRWDYWKFKCQNCSPLPSADGEGQNYKRIRKNRFSLRFRRLKNGIAHGCPLRQIESSFISGAFLRDQRGSFLNLAPLMIREDNLQHEFVFEF